MLLSHLGMVEGPAGQPRRALGEANGLTLVRAGLVPALALLTASPAAWLAVLAVALATDALDGVVARRQGTETRLGAHADPAVDTALAIVAALSAAAAGWLPWWAAALVVMRYALPPLLVAVHYFARAAAPAGSALVPGRVPGLVVASGLALAPLEAPAALSGAIVAAGALAGLATAGVSARRALSPARA